MTAIASERGRNLEREQLVAGYVSGQIGRRVFLRRLVSTGVAVAAAIAYADLLRAVPAAATTQYDYYEYVVDYQYLRKDLSIAAVGKVVEWGFDAYSVHTHTVTDGTGWLDSGFVPPAKAYDREMPYAGTYKYRCVETTHPANPMNGKVKVPVLASPPSGTTSDFFTIQWGSQYASSPYLFDVQLKKPSDTKFHSWQSGVGESMSLYTTGEVGVHRFRARLRNTDTGQKTGWSPSRTITVS